MNLKFLQLCLIVNQKAIAGAVTFGVISIVATRGQWDSRFRACIRVNELFIPVALKSHYADTTASVSKFFKFPFPKSHPNSPESGSNTSFEVKPSAAENSSRFNSTVSSDFPLISVLDLKKDKIKKNKMSSACSHQAFGAMQVTIECKAEISRTFHWPLWGDQAVTAANLTGFDSGK